MMTRNLVAFGASAALCLASSSPALAQEHRFSGFDAPRGTTATINLRIPLGGRTGARQRASLGLTIGHGREQPGFEPDGRSVTRQLALLDLRLDRTGLQRARLAGLDLRQLQGDRLQLGGDNKKSLGLAFFAFLLMVAAGYLILDGDGDPESALTPPPPPPPPIG